MVETTSSSIEVKKVAGIIGNSLPIFCERLIEDSFLFYDLPAEVVTKTPHCGVVSALIVDELSHHGYFSELLLADISDLSDSPDVKENHAVGMTQIDRQEYMIDATFAQFFTKFGLHYEHILYDTDVYPTEECIIFRPEEAHEVALWAARAVQVFWLRHGYSIGFQRANNYTHPDDGNHWYTLLRRPTTYATIQNFFESLWDVKRYKPKPLEGDLKEDVEQFSLRSRAT